MHIIIMMQSSNDLSLDRKLVISGRVHVMHVDHCMGFNSGYTLLIDRIKVHMYMYMYMLVAWDMYM